MKARASGGDTRDNVRQTTRRPAVAPPDFRNESLADIVAALVNVRLIESGHHRSPSSCPISANSRHALPRLITEVSSYA